MLYHIYAAADRLGMSRGTLLALAREAAHDGSLRSVDHLPLFAQPQLLTLLGWISRDEAELLARPRVFLWNAA